MPSRTKRAALSAILGPALLLLLCGGAAGQGADRPSSAGLDDEGFIRELEAAGPNDPVDRKRLSRLFFGIAATLEGGRSGVRLLQSAPNARLLSTEAARAMASARFRAYAEAVERFRSVAVRLLDDPDSATQLYGVLFGGYRACWRLAEYTRLMEGYGARSSDLMSILSSTEACARFRRAALQGCVERLVAQDLAETDALRRELRDAEVELDELERLLEDLRRIDAGD